MIRFSSLPRVLAGAAALCATSLRAAAPVFPEHPNETDSPFTMPAGKTLVIPIACDDADGDALTYTVTSSSPHVFARLKTGNPHMKIHVHTDNDGSGQPYDGDMEFQLYRDFAPDTASFLAGYAQSGYYENVIFHRIIPGFVIQGGDPAGTGSGITPAPNSVDLNLNYSLPHEFRSELIFTGRGQLAMANSVGGYSQSFPANDNIQYRTGSFLPTNGTQFFITLDPLRDFGPSKVNLDYKHTIFGQLIRGFDVMEKVEAVPTTTDKPNVAVKMTALSAAPSKTDAVLLVSATTTTTSTITVTAKDPGGNTASRTINVTVVTDTINDPPILEPLDPVVIPVGGIPNFRVRSFDLESDAISTRFPVRDVLQNQTIYAGLNRGNLRAVARPTPGAWDVAISVSALNDPLAQISPFDVSRFQMLEIGVGDRILAATPQTIEATAGASTGSVRVATFRHGGTGLTAAEFVATVKWGDGSNANRSTDTNSPVTVLRSPANPSVYEVRATHTYARQGVYPLQVIIDGPLGSTDMAKGMAVVHDPSATLRAVGQQLEFNASPLYSGRPVATFSDSTPGVKVSHFTATIDWGDGQRTAGGIRQTGAGKFAVFGAHRYLDPTRYSVAVHVHRMSPAADAVAWTSIKMGGFVGPPQLPPYAKANITSFWTEEPTKIYRPGATDIVGTLFLINGGQKPTSKWKIRTWLSNDTVLNSTGPNPDTLLKIGPLNKLLTEIALNALPPGGGGNFGFRNEGGVDFTIRLPAGETAAGKYLLTQLVYNDPITDLMAVPKVVVSGPFNGILVTSPQFVTGPVLSVKEGETNNPQRTAIFKVRLDTLPTANVTIPLEIVNGNGVVDNSRATLDKPQLLLTPAFGTTEQVVVVSSVDDAIKNGNATFTIRLKAATSTDTRFNGMDAGDVILQVLDNEP
jgi:cyclophilin family peptidyl-prolyl cis-trans isomerase